MAHETTATLRAQAEQLLTALWQLPDPTAHQLSLPVVRDLIAALSRVEAERPQTVELRRQEQSYWVAALNLVADELSALTEPLPPERGIKMAAILRNAAYRVEAAPIRGDQERDEFMRRLNFAQERQVHWEVEAEAEKQRADVADKARAFAEQKQADAEHSRDGWRQDAETEKARADAAEAKAQRLDQAITDARYIAGAWLTVTGAARETAMRQRLEAAQGLLDYNGAALRVFAEQDTRAKLEAAETLVETRTQERDAARSIVANVNNSVFGSQGYFTTPDCVEAIENLKRHSNRVLHEKAERDQTRRQDFEALATVVGQFLDVWNEVEPKINGIIGLQSARSGFTWQYDGKPLPIKELREAFAAYLQRPPQQKKND